ncbi:hypothetical protein BG004_003825 [Podila humilis]|nr:hypothetical protein BG004_003825 [Podila humilis]
MMAGLTLIASKTRAGADSISNMSDTSATCSSIDNSSSDSLYYGAEDIDCRNSRSDNRSEGPRTRSSSRRRSLESRKRASQKKNKKRREREALARKKQQLNTDTDMSNTSPSELASPTSPTSSSDMSDHSTTASTAELDLGKDKDSSELEYAQKQDEERQEQKTTTPTATATDVQDNVTDEKPSTATIASLTSRCLPTIQESTSAESFQLEQQDEPRTLASDVIATVELGTIQEDQRKEPTAPWATCETQSQTASTHCIENKSITVNSDTVAELTTGTITAVLPEELETLEQNTESSGEQASSNASDTYTQSLTLTSNEAVSNLSSWSAASETVATVAIQCLTRDKDMELSYVAILSAVTVLQEKNDEDASNEVKAQVEGLYDQLFSTLCGSMSESMDKETIRQGAMAPEALYSMLYNAVLQAGYNLKTGTHLLMAKYLIDHKKPEDAQECLDRIHTLEWTGPIYRTSIIGFLSSKPRQLQEAELTLEKYIDFQEASNTDDERNVDQAIRNWFKLQLDASKWDDVKIQYERRRARLVDAPSNIDRFTAHSEIESSAKSSLEQQRSPQRQAKHERSVSHVGSPSTSPAPIGHLRSPSAHLSSPSAQQKSSTGHQRTPSGTMPSWPSGASATLNASPVPATSVAKGPFAFLSSLKFTSRASDATKTAAADSTALPSRIHSNRHLTVLDNGMLEDCIRHKEFEYGWKHIYERMGPALEDSETFKIAMRLCRQAFMGHNGKSESSNATVLSVKFQDENPVQKMEDAAKEASIRKQDLEIWEARSWAVYNKAMVNPHTFTSGTSQSATVSSASSTGISSTALFFHDILTVAISSLETSSRFLKSFKVYSALRSDPQNQQLLRDPFVMTCMIKAIYDAVLVVVSNPEQQPLPLPGPPAPQQRHHHRRSSSLSLNRPQPMTLGPLMDLAFEIYADMRNVGSIRHLPSLLNLAPTSPTGRSRKNSVMFGTSSPTSSAPIASSDTSSTTTEEAEDKANSTNSVSPRQSFTALAMAVFQDLNPSLKPNAQAKRLPSEIYLALVHLCIQVPVFRMSSQVVKTILDDMNTSTGRQSSCHLDRHLAAALQQYHDTWMCEETETKTSCVYQRWMYRPESFVEEHVERHSEEDAVSIDVPLEGVADMVCNDEMYWDLWSADDVPLKDMIFTQQRVDMLAKHIATHL